MVKKILLWAFYIIFVGLLVLGGLRRTAYLNESGGEANPGRPRPSRSVLSKEGNTDEHSSETIDSDWIILNGTIVDFSRRGLLVALLNGDSLELAGQPWRFAQSQGFNPGIGEVIEVEGFIEEGEFKVARIKTVNGKIIALRSESGQPLWVSTERGE